MGSLLDASALDPPVVSLPLMQYTIRRHGVEVQQWPPARWVDPPPVVWQGWEVWCEATEMRRR